MSGGKGGFEQYLEPGLVVSVRAQSTQEVAAVIISILEDLISLELVTNGSVPAFEEGGHVKLRYWDQESTAYYWGAEAGASFSYNNRQPEIDFGYQGGAPAIFYQRANANHVWMLQRIYRNNLAGNLAYDQDGDGIPESLTRVDLADAVMNQCDGLDGITMVLLTLRWVATSTWMSIWPKKSVPATWMGTPVLPESSSRPSRTFTAERETATAFWFSKGRPWGRSGPGRVASFPMGATT
jgi:hypothetical protein